MERQEELQALRFGTHDGAVSAFAQDDIFERVKISDRLFSGDLLDDFEEGRKTF
jgi:hypothetical protein